MICPTKGKYKVRQSVTKLSDSDDTRENKGSFFQEAGHGIVAKMACEGHVRQPCSCCRKQGPGFRITAASLSLSGKLFQSGHLSLLSMNEVYCHHINVHTGYVSGAPMAALEALSDVEIMPGV